MKRTLKLKFDEPVEELVNYYQNQEKKDKREKRVWIFFIILSSILLGIVLMDFSDANYTDIILAVVYSILMISVTNEIFKKTFKASLVNKLHNLKKTKKLLTITYDTLEKIVTYTYDDKGVVKYAHFSIDKVETRSDINEDTIFIGKEFVYAKKWQS